MQLKFSRVPHINPFSQTLEHLFTQELFTSDRENCCVYKQTQRSFKTDKSGTLEQTFENTVTTVYGIAELTCPRIDRVAAKIKGRNDEMRVRPTSTPHLSVSHWVYDEGLVMSGDTFLWKYQSMLIKAVIRKCDPLKDEHPEDHLIFRTHISPCCFASALRPQVSYSMRCCRF